MNHDPHQHERDEALDDLVRQALDADADADAGDDRLRLARLQRYWLTESRRQASWSRTKWTVMVAAAVVLLTTAIKFVGRNAPNEPALVAKNHNATPQPSEPQPNELQPIEPHAREPLLTEPQPISEPTWRIAPAPVEEARPTGRAPTDYERWMFAARTRTRVEPAAPTLAEVVDEVLAAQAPTTGSQAAAPGLAAFDRGDVEQALLNKLPGADAPQRREIVTLLAAYGSQRAVAPLLQIGRDETVRHETLDALKAIVGVERFPEVIRATNDPAFRVAVVNWLLDEQSEAALVSFLRLVHGPKTRAAALAAAMDRRELPIDEFVALLDHEDPTIRFATSLALGQFNRCEMTDALITRVSERPSRSKEAWFALFGCRCESAAQFLATAARSPQMLGQLNNARIQWSLAMP